MLAIDKSKIIFYHRSVEVNKYFLVFTVYQSRAFKNTNTKNNVQVFLCTAGWLRVIFEEKKMFFLGGVTEPAGMCFFFIIIIIVFF